MRKIASWIVDHSLLVACLTVIATVASTFYSIKLYKNLRTDLEELLPTDARSVQDLTEIQARLKSIENLAVLVFSDDIVGSKRFIQDLGRRLEKGPPEVIASVEYQIQKELEFFNSRKALYVEEADLQKVQGYIKQKIQYERNFYNPLTMLANMMVPPPGIDLIAIRDKYASRASRYTNFPDGYYATKDEKKRVLLAYLPGKSSGVQRVYKLKAFVENTIHDLKPETYAKDIKILYTGGVQNTIEEQSALLKDLELSTAVVTLLVTLCLWLYFRVLGPTLVLLYALIVGTLWTFGASYFLVGYLNANSAFLGSIIMGNGINFSIIPVARYLEERGKSRPHREALIDSLVFTASATWTAALAAGLSYGSLMITSFRGFRQFGIIGLTGMVLCWIASFIVLPTGLHLINKIRPIKPRPPTKRWFAGRLAQLVNRHPGKIAIVSVMLTAFSLFQLTRYQPSILETDLRKLRNKTSMEKGSGYLSIHLDEIFGRYMSPLAILTDSQKDAQIISAKLKALQAEQGKSSLIANVQSLEDFLPTQQPKKLQTLQEIRKTLRPSILRRLSPADLEQAQTFLNPNVQRSVAWSDLPELLKKRFTEKDGSVGKLVLVEPPLGSATLDGPALSKWIKQIREVGDSLGKRAPLAGALAVSSDMIESISKDGPKATAISFILVYLLIILIFRRPKLFLPVWIALFMGTIWLFGFILFFWYKINFVNFIALPITLGIGVDYAVNVFQRYQSDPSEDMIATLRETGSAVALCSVTTIIGWSSLIIAENQAFVSFGVLAVVGEITCIVAALVSLPAFIILGKR